jgi:hypothetical protein
MMMHDLFPNLPLALHKIGSNCCELFFFSWTTCEKKHNVCIGDAVEQTSHIGWIEQIKFEERSIDCGIKMMKCFLLGS